MPGPVTIRTLDAISEFELAVALQKTVWGFADVDLVPVSEIVAAEHNDGIVLGAFDASDRLVGFCFSFVGRRAGRTLQYSRMLAVHPERRGEGLGAALKLEQKRIALERGYRWMEWTFDPLEARNARLNLRRLGARVRTYYRNIYGLRSSQFDLGVPTDRCLAEWDLTEDLEVTGARRRSVAPAGVPAFGVSTDEDFPRPLAVSFDVGAGVVLVPVPSSFQRIREASPEAALAWRLAVREAFEMALSAGLHAVDFVPDLPGRAGLGAHVLARVVR